MAACVCTPPLRSSDQRRYRKIARTERGKPVLVHPNGFRRRINVSIDAGGFRVTRWLIHPKTQDLAGASRYSAVHSEGHCDQRRVIPMLWTNAITFLAREP